ncbi:MAG: ABC transporter substrate-binding protein [Nitrospinota bacterium]
MTRRRIPSLFLSALVGAFFATAGMASVQAAERVKFFLDWVPYGKHASFYAGIEQGIYKRYGLDVTIQAGKGSGLSVKTIGAKGADYGHADMGTLIIARANNPDLRVKEIAMLHHDNLFYIAFLKKSGIKSPKDLEGKTIGSPVMNAARIVFPALAPFTGMDPSKVIWVNMQAASQEPSLFAEKVDAIVTYRTRDPSLMGKAKEVGKPVGSLKFSDFGVDIYSNGIIAHEDTLKNRPGRTRRFVVASLEAFRWSVENPEKAIDSFISKNPSVSRKLARGHWEIGVDVALTKGSAKTGLGFMLRDKVQRTIDTMFKFRKLKRKPVPEEIYTNEFVAVFPKRRK